MASKKWSVEKAAAEISNMLLEGKVTSAAQAVEQRPELKPGLALFEEDSQPKSRGSGPMIRDLGW